MPLEIRELHIKVTVSDDAQPLESNNSSTLSDTQEQQQQLIQACVEQVLEILKSQKER